jgi:hypothetical protein
MGVDKVNILRDEILYINSKGKRVKKIPRTCLGAFYYIDAVYRNFSYSSFLYIAPQNIRDEETIKKTRQTLLDKVLKELGAERK